MMMGKRPRQHIRRTTSMTGFEVDPMDVAEALQPSDRLASDWLSMGHVAPRNGRRSSGDFMAVEIAPFLKNCGLCNRRLRPGKDIYMYRGEIAYCSLECRAQQITNDECIEKRALSAIKKDAVGATASGPEGSDTAESTVAMA